MQRWLIEPRDGLAFRDGRPNGPGGESRSLRFPMPQTVAGAVRTRAGLDRDGRFDPSRIEALKRLTVEGPLLARQADQGWELLVQAPQDALWSEEDCRKALLHLRPLEETFLCGGTVKPEDVLAVGLEASPKGKPPKDVPAFWTWKHLEAWLRRPGALKADEVIDMGQEALVQDERLSVAIDPQTGTYCHGALFGVTSLCFRSLKEPQSLGKVEELGLAFRTDAELVEGPGFLGGKNRLAVFRKGNAPAWPEACPFVNELAKSGRLRVVLVTPGIFDEGWKPSWLLEERQGLKPVPKAARVDRPETLSGWDYAARNVNGKLGRTKPTRRAASAGSVYWLELGGTEAQRKAWIQELWMKPVSDKEEDRRDGFGMAVMGVWA